MARSSIAPGGTPRDNAKEVARLRLNVTLYRVMAYVTGVILIVLCVFAIAQAFTNDEAIVNAIGTVHGLLYIVYLIVSYPLTRRLRLPVWPTVAVLLAGTIPVMTFVVERRISHRYIDPALAGVTAGLPVRRGAFSPWPQPWRILSSMATVFLDAPRPLAFAHRGGAAHAPENSWRAFEHAVSLGYRYLETDLQATADGVLVAFHDKTLTRVCGQDGRVSRLSHAELSAARIDGTEPIPRLEDLLAAWPDVRFNLDVKDVPAIAPLPEVLRRTNAWDRVCVVSFSASRLRAARRALGRPVCMAASPLGTAMVRFGGPRGRNDRGGPGQQGPRQPARPRQQWPLTDWLSRAGVRCVQVPGSMATESFIGRAQALGLQVHAWTVNERPAMEQLLDLGIDGIMTDETLALRDVLAARHQWHPRPSDPH